MPLPLGHAAIGWAALETIHNPHPGGTRLGLFIYAALLANLPDLDILVGLLGNGNGYAFHRGPTHSLLFALFAGFFASRAWRVWHRIPQLKFSLCALLIFSHVVADMLLTSSAVSLLWPLEINFSQAHNGWTGVMRMALFQSVQDVIIAAAALTYVIGLRLYRRERRMYGRFSPTVMKLYK